MKRKHFLGVMLLFSAVAFSVFSCKKQSAIEAPVETAKIEKLAAEFTKPIAENYASLKQEYNNLSEAELRLFFLNIYRINSRKNKPAMSEEAFIKQFEVYNKESNEKFGKTFNKLSDENFVKVFSPDQDSRVAGRVIDPPPPDPTCPFLPYPEYFYWGNPNAAYSPPFISWRLVDFYRGDCDGYELTYNAFWNRLRAITPLGAQAIALFLQGDHITAKTRVLHKKSSADYWFGNVYGINDNIRMSALAEE